jgi:REP element-mobilizing transposase RayT
MTATNQESLFKYMAGILKNKGCHPYKVGGYKNHIHLVFSLNKTVSLSDIVKEIKQGSGDFMKSNKSLYQNFPGWQVGYGAFTYSQDSVDNLIKYVENQHEHHRKRTFQEELIEFLDKYNVEYKKEYLYT